MPPYVYWLEGITFLALTGLTVFALSRGGRARREVFAVYRAPSVVPLPEGAVLLRAFGSLAVGQNGISGGENLNVIPCDEALLVELDTGPTDRLLLPWGALEDVTDAHSHFGDSLVFAIPQMALILRLQGEVGLTVLGHWRFWHRTHGTAA